MTKKVYRVMIGGLPHTIRYPEGEQPEGAELVESKQAAPANKSRTPANKGRKPASKSEK